MAAGVVSFVSFAFIFWLDGHDVSRLGIWWAEALFHAFIPVVLAFIILYRSSWHQEMSRSARAMMMGLLSCLIFPGALIVAGIALVLVIIGYYCFSDLTRFHY